MRRVLVIGPGGAGKSTFAVRLGARLGLPVYHLDACYWRPGWSEPPREVWAATVRRLVAGEAWVMDGNYGGTLELRLAAADTVVFLDTPRLRCLWRVVRRRLRYHRRSRPDMAPGCPERLDAAFLWWIWTYRRRRRGPLMDRLAAVADTKRVVVLRSACGARRFLATLGPGSAATAGPPAAGAGP